MSAFLVHRPRQLGGRLSTEQSLEDLFIRFRDLPAASFLPASMLDEVNGLAQGDDHEDTPEIVAVLQKRKFALLNSLAKTVEGAQRHIFLVGSPARRMAQAPS